MADMRLFNRPDEGDSSEVPQSEMNIFSRPVAGGESAPISSAAARAFGLAVACFLFAFLFGYLASANPAKTWLYMPVGVMCDWLAFGFLFAAGVLYVLRK